MAGISLFGLVARTKKSRSMFAWVIAKLRSEDKLSIAAARRRGLAYFTARWKICGVFYGGDVKNAVGIWIMIW